MREIKAFRSALGSEFSRFSILLVMLALLLVAGCSSNEEAEGDNQDNLPPSPAVEENHNESMDVDNELSEPTLPLGDLERFATEDIAEFLRAEPGQFDAVADKDTIIDIMEQAVEAGLESDELFYALLDLGAADFREYQRFIDDYEVQYSDTTARPGESTDASGQVSGTNINVQILFDASGSMAAWVDDGIKIDLAKEAVREFVAQLPAETNVSLRVYGHEGSSSAEDREISCAGTEVVYPLGPYEEAAFGNALEQFNPVGYTPIALAMEEAMKDLSAAGNEDGINVVYIVSDGEETCGGDPVQAAEDLYESEMEAVVNIIGFDVSDAEQQTLMAIAEAGNGTYLSANSGQELREALREERDQQLQAWADWRDENQQTILEERDASQEEIEALREASRSLTVDEADQLVAIVDELADKIEFDYNELRLSVFDRRNMTGIYLQQEFTDIRHEVRDRSMDIHDDIRDESIDERNQMMNQND